MGPVRLDVRLRLAHDWRGFDPDIDAEGRNWRMRRGGVNGEIADHVAFEIERDLESDGDWRDVFVNWRTHRQLEMTAGRFKVPFGRERLRSSTAIDFAARALVSDTIAPARDAGVMAHGRFLQQGFTYEVGVFRDDGDRGALGEPPPSGLDVDDLGPSFAARVTATPLRPLAETFRQLRVGAAYGTVNVPEGRHGLRGRTVYETTEFFERVYVNGRRTRVGLEAYYTPGPMSVAAEWMQAREQRRDQGLGGEDLSDAITTGWYVSGTWLLTGEDKEDFEKPRRPLFGDGLGAFEVAARYEKLRFASAGKTGPALRDPRAEHFLGNGDAVWTLGLNWFPSRWVRVIANAVREQLDDAERTPIPGRTVFWSSVLRAQLAF